MNRQDLVELLPPGAVVVTSADVATTPEQALADLHPSEEAAVARAAPRRRAEFALTRACARVALGELGVPPAPVGRGVRGMPVWPDGVVGSLSHCEGLRVAAVARSARIRSLGVDVEPRGSLPPKVLEAVALPDEQEQVERLGLRYPGPDWDKLVFTSKEAVYKVWFPLTRRWLGFEEAHLSFEVGEASGGQASGTFSARILVDPAVVDGGAPLEQVVGRWRIGPTHVASAGVPGAADTVDR